MSTIKVWLLFLILCALPFCEAGSAPIRVGSIIAPMGGCVTWDELKAHGDLIYRISGPYDYRVGAWQTDKPGCRPTTDDNITGRWIIPGGKARLTDLHHGETLEIRLDWQRMEQCGTVQGDLFSNGPSNVALLITDGVTWCEDKPPVVLKPPQPPPPFEPPFEPPIEPPYEPPPPTPVPEPGTMLLVGGALAIRAMKLLWR